MAIYKKRCPTSDVYIPFQSTLAMGLRLSDGDHQRFAEDNGIDRAETFR